MVSLKIVYGSSIRRVQLKKPTVEGIAKVFSTLFEGETAASFKYEDDEGDLVTFSLDTELAEAIHVSQQLKKSAFKVIITAAPKDSFVVVPEQAKKPDPEAAKPAQQATTADDVDECQPEEEKHQEPEPQPQPQPEQDEEQASQELTAERAADLLAGILTDPEAVPLVQRFAQAMLANDVLLCKDASVAVTTALSAVPELLARKDVQELLPALAWPNVQQVIGHKMAKLQQHFADPIELASALSEVDEVVASFLSQVAANLTPEALAEAERRLAEKKEWWTAKQEWAKKWKPEGRGRWNWSHAQQAKGCGSGRGRRWGRDRANGGGWWANNRWWVKDWHKQPAKLRAIVLAMKDTKKQVRERKWAEKQAEAAAHPKAQSIHRSIVCDGCGVTPIVGNRYKCTQCRDFDLCEACESSDQHPAHHNLVKMKVEQQPRWHGRGRGWQGRSGGRWLGHMAQQFAHAWQPQQQQQQQPVHQQARFLRDENLPDKSSVLPGSTLTKSWTLNASTAWKEGTKLSYVRGDPLATQPTFDVPAAAQGENVIVSADLKMPKESGRYSATFRLQDPAGEPFGPRLWVDLISQSEAAALAMDAQATFVRDVTLPDGLVVLPGSAHTKSWAVRAATDIPEGTKLAYTSGHRLATEATFDVPATKAGDEVVVSADLQMPVEAGEASAVFRLLTPNGVPFGDHLWVKVQVTNKVPAKVMVAPVVDAADAVAVADPVVQAANVPPVAVAKKEKEEEEVHPQEEAALEVLAGMGFAERELNKFLLRQHKNNVQQVVSWLLEHSKGQ